jgi:hypothetical protein
MKSKRDLPGWETSAVATKTHRPRNLVYDRAFPAPRYVEAMRRGQSNPFVRIEEAPDSGRFIRSMDKQQTAELLYHGACVTDSTGEVVVRGNEAYYFIWPHVASRGPRDNSGVYGLICPAKADLARFTQNRAKGEDETLRRVGVAADLWLPGAECQWPCKAATARLAGGADYQPEDDS